MSTNYVKTPCTVLFSGPPVCGKSQLVLNLLETFYKNHFENIIIIYLTIQDNDTYKITPWILLDPNVYLIEPKR